MDTLAVLDLVTAKVRLARTHLLVCPTISDDGKMLLRQARHPLLVRLAQEAAQRGERREVVPDRRADRGRFRFAGGNRPQYGW